MTADDKSILKGILDHISGMDYIKPEDLPNIDLYMDQVTTFMEDQLASTKRHDDDKILTKTMINNYAKNNIIPTAVHTLDDVNYTLDCFEKCHKKLLAGEYKKPMPDMSEK